MNKDKREIFLWIAAVGVIVLGIPIIGWGYLGAAKAPIGPDGVAIPPKWVGELCWISIWWAGFWLFVEAVWTLFRFVKARV